MGRLRGGASSLQPKAHAMLDLRRVVFPARFLLASCLAAVGGTALAHEGEHDPTIVHVVEMLHYAVDHAGPSGPEQVARLTDLVQAANTDLLALHAAQSSNRARVFALLTAPALDRAAIDAALAQRTALAGQFAQREAAFYVAVAEQLSPAQRQALAARVADEAH
jgi:Spy/CpxP family protein refolding chaperone